MKNTADPSFEQVLADNKSIIYRICKIYATSPVEPEDLFQEVTAHIWKALSTFDGRARLSTWIYKISLNVCMRYKSKLDTRNRDMLRLDAIQFQVPESIPDLYEQEKFNALSDCIRSLNEIEQSIAIMVLDELKYKEIADITGLTENHIAVKMKRIKQILLKCINSKLR